jgi:Lon protease-like protein
VAAGTQRFRLLALDDSGPYLRGQVDLLAEDTGDESAAGLAAQSVQRGFRAYLEALAQRGGTQVSVPELPDEPAALSYLVATAMIIDLSDRQALLAEPDAVSRLGAERAMLSRETSMLRSLTSTPAPELRYSPYNPN